MNRFHSLLALLLVGSASLQAQSDPFPDHTIPAYKYQGSMICTSQVVMNGEIVTDAVVAAYCGDDFRGKNSTREDPNHPNHVYLTIYGDDTGDSQYLHFKVFTQGKVFTCDPTPALLYTFYGIVGSTSNPYIIDITPVSLADDADNTTTLTTWKNRTCDAVLTGRTLYKDGDWNTICLPFALTASEVNEHLENPAGLMTLSSSSFDDTTGTLTLNFSDELENGIAAGKPYIVKWAKADGYTVDGGFDITDPVFTSVTVSSTAPATATDGSVYVDFCGTFSPEGIYTADNTKLYLGEGNTLYYPTATDFEVKSCRGYFQLKGGLTCGTPTAHIRAFNLSFGDGSEVTGIVSVSKESGSEGAAGAWFDLNGRRLSGNPTARGIYIKDGRKVVVK